MLINQSMPLNLILYNHRVNPNSIENTITLYFAANLDFALNFSPKKNSVYTPTLHPIVSPPSSETPRSTPRLWNSG